MPARIEKGDSEIEQVDLDRTFLPRANGGLLLELRSIVPKGNKEHRSQANYHWISNNIATKGTQ